MPVVKEQVTASRILLVEDEVLIRMVAMEAFEDEGFEVTEAWNGDEAIRLLDGPNGFDLLFTDVQMPGTRDGVDVAMHARRRYPTMPVLVVSGYAVQLLTRLKVLDPAAIFMPKPYRLWEIMAAVRRLMTTI